MSKDEAGSRPMERGAFAEAVAGAIVGPMMKDGSVSLEGWAEAKVTAADWGLGPVSNAWRHESGLLMAEVAGGEGVYALGHGLTGRPDPVLTEADAAAYLPPGLGMARMLRDEGDVAIHGTRDGDSGRGALLELARADGGWRCRILRARFKQID